MTGVWGRHILFSSQPFAYSEFVLQTPSYHPKSEAPRLMIHRFIDLRAGTRGNGKNLGDCILIAFLESALRVSGQRDPFLENETVSFALPSISMLLNAGVAVALSNRNTTDQLSTKVMLMVKSNRLWPFLFNNARPGIRAVATILAGASYNRRWPIFAEPIPAVRVWQVKQRLNQQDHGRYQCSATSLQLILMNRSWYSTT
ncbi:hypothetical protein B0H66DRAFT_284303 [Apodospora peruviana]|uniref:Uncharacterized protein n=1 Tax=Apodospora peruviana TaxID=516989 RepID=A0AAE0I069_9PEZI|nr:hypothetical protein B0H66DRAFT_284303 [Apodospora peruviana]